MGDTPSFSLIKLDGKPLEKLIEVISNGIGVLYRPTSIRKEADAKSYEIKIIEKAKSEAASLGKMIEYETLTKIEKKFLNKESKRVNNIEAIISLTAEQLKTNPNVSDKKVNPDWSSRFFDHAQDISDDDMQKIWANLLAQEIATPGVFSFRAMQTLSMMTKAEALKFIEIVHNSISINGLMIHRTNTDLLTPTDTWLFEEIGILTNKEGEEYFGGDSGQIKQGNIKMSLHFIKKNIDKRLGRFIFSVTRQYVFTSTGVELSKLVSSLPEKINVNKLKETLISLIKTNNSNRISHRNLDIDIKSKKLESEFFEFVIVLKEKKRGDLQ